MVMGGAGGGEAGETSDAATKATHRGCGWAANSPKKTHMVTCLPPFLTLEAPQSILQITGGREKEQGSTLGATANGGFILDKLLSYSEPWTPRQHRRETKLKWLSGPLLTPWFAGPTGAAPPFHWPIIYT